MPWKNENDIEYVSGIYLPLLEGYAQTDNEQYRKYYNNILKNASRQVERFITPTASVNADKLAHDMDIGDLRLYNWSNQTKEMRDYKRAIFHWEHVYPVSLMVSDLLNLESRNIEDISTIISKTDIAWILKTEDKCLTKNGYRSKRPDNPWDAYHHSDIEIVSEKVSH